MVCICSIRLKVSVVSWCFDTTISRRLDNLMWSNRFFLRTNSDFDPNPGHEYKVLPSAISRTPGHEYKVLPSAINRTPGHKYKVLPSAISPPLGHTVGFRMAICPSAQGLTARISKDINNLIERYENPDNSDGEVRLNTIFLHNVLRISLAILIRLFVRW